MSEQEIKPCPFCGSDIIETWYKRENRRWHVFCGECLADGPADGKSEQDAIKSWNTRAGNKG